MEVPAAFSSGILQRKRKRVCLCRGLMVQFIIVVKCISLSYSSHKQIRIERMYQIVLFHCKV
jgi:hypothetical protein